MSTRFCEMAGIGYPIVAFSHCRDVVAAVSRAGGLGVFGSANTSPEELEIELAWIDANVGEKPYGVDVLAPAPKQDGGDTADLDVLRSRIPDTHRQFVEDLLDEYSVPPDTGIPVHMPFRGSAVSRRVLEDQVEVALRHPTKFLVSGLGPFAPDVVERAHAQGTLIGGLVGTPEHARRHVASGADAVVAQGSEAGGHTGDMSTMVLTPQVVDAIAPVPVLAAGGIATGRQVAAALALGASAVWMGSAWLTSSESDVDPTVVNKLLAARSSQAVQTRSITGRPVRVLRTAYEEAWERPEAPPTLPSPYQGLLAVPAIRRIYQHHVEPLMGQAVGQVVGLMNERRSCKAIIDDLIAELIETIEIQQKILEL